MQTDLDSLFREADSIADIDRHFGAFICTLDGSQNQALYYVAVLLSSQTREGNICLPLPALSDKDFLAQKFGEHLPELPPGISGEAIFAAVEKSAVVGTPGEYKPILLDEHQRLYLHRYWSYEQRLATAISEKIATDASAGNAEQLRSALHRYFPQSDADEINWQKIAAATALLQNFCVITGGPGTGKTHTVARVLAVLLEHDPACRIKLAAPTGKAAIRLQESVQGFRQSVDCPEHLRMTLPAEAQTLHRLLGTIPHSPHFRHHRDNPLQADVVIVDEASMVDLALMVKLVEALEPPTKLILLGDHHQLASVEAGAVLADICGPGRLDTFSASCVEKLRLLTGDSLSSVQTSTKSPPIQDCIVELQTSHRFATRRGITEASRAINAGDADGAFAILQQKEHADVCWFDFASASLPERLRNVFSTLNTAAVKAPEKRFAEFNRQRILCAVREGPHGVRQINAHIEQYMRQKLRVKSDATWYAGQPILICKNDYALELFNGDVGIILPDMENPDGLAAFFPGEQGRLRKLSPYRLPEFETAYAMTIHKSQGSEFEHVILVLPERDTPLLTRELIYTGITRATAQVDIWGNAEIFKQAVRRKIRRFSGLPEKLWEPGVG